MNKIENYELTIEDKKAVITYDITESKSLNNSIKVFMIAKEKDNNYNLIISNEDGEDLVCFLSIHEKLIRDIKDKKVFIAGLNPLNGDIESVNEVVNVSIEKNRKFKVK